MDTNMDTSGQNLDSSADGIDIDPTPPGINPAYAKGKEPKIENKPSEQKVEQPSDEAAQQEAKAAAAALKKLKIKGKEIEVDEDKYHQYAQKGAAATEAWQEAARMKREAEAFFQKLRTNPKEILTDPNIGFDIKQIAKDIIWEEMQDAKLSPEEKARRDELKELQELREKEKARREQEEQSKHAELKQRYSEDYDRKLTETLSKAGLPKTTGTVRRMTDYMLQDIRNGVYRDPSDYVDVVRQDYISDISEMFGQLPGDAILKLIGEPVAKKMREADLARLKTTTPDKGHTFVPGKGMVKTDQAPKKLSGHDWERQIRREMLGR